MVPAEIQSFETLPGCLAKAGLRNQPTHHLEHSAAYRFHGALTQHEDASAHPTQQAEEVLDPKAGLAAFFKSTFARFRPKFER